MSQDTEEKFDPLAVAQHEVIALANRLRAAEAREARLRAMLQEVYDTYRDAPMEVMGRARVLLADPTSQRVVEEWRALTRLAETARDHRDGACTKPHRELDEALAAVEQARQA